MKEIHISDIEGFRIGHAQDEKGATGCTAIICEEGAVSGCDVRGGGPATRETPLLDPVKNREYIPGTEACLSTPESRVQIWVIPTDEERTIYNEIRNMK